MANIITTAALVDNSIVLAYKQGVMIANGESQKLEPYVTVKEEIGEKSIRFTKYSRLDPATTPLVDGQDVESKALTDSEIVLLPKEYGDAVTTTQLASLQTGGRVDEAKAKVIGIQMGETQDALIIAAVLASANKTNVAPSAASLDAAYSRLVSKSVVGFSDGLFVAVMPEVEIAKIRNDASFIDVSKYASGELGALALLRNEVGMFKGFRIIRHQRVPAKSVMCFGYNAIGKAVSLAPGLVIAPPNDKLQRNWHMGWKGVFTYDIVDGDAIENLVVTP